MKMKARNVVLLLATCGMAAAPVVSLAAEPKPSGVVHETGDYIEDSALTTRVKAALLAEKNLKSLGISVESTEGVVTLSGELISTAQIDQAVDVAKHVEGVRDVHNTLTLEAN